MFRTLIVLFSAAATAYAGPTEEIRADLKSRETTVVVRGLEAVADGRGDGSELWEAVLEAAVTLDGVFGDRSKAPLVIAAMKRIRATHPNQASLGFLRLAGRSSAFRTPAITEFLSDPPRSALVISAATAPNGLREDMIALLEVAARVPAPFLERLAIPWLRVGLNHQNDLVVISAAQAMDKLLAHPGAKAKLAVLRPELLKVLTDARFRNPDPHRYVDMLNPRVQVGDTAVEVLGEDRELCAALQVSYAIVRNFRMGAVEVEGWARRINVARGRKVRAATMAADAATELREASAALALDRPDPIFTADHTHAMLAIAAPEEATQFVRDVLALRGHDRYKVALIMSLVESDVPSLRALGQGHECQMALRSLNQ